MHQTLYKRDEARFWIMRFERAGESLPMHQHPPERHHATVCIQGRVLCHDEGYKWHQLLNPGDVCLFPHQGPHAVVALDDDTILAQINLTPSKIPPSPSDERYLEGFGQPHPLADMEAIKRLLNQEER